jgi:hypothetical protein
LFFEQQAEIIGDYFAWTKWDLRPDFKRDDWPMPTVGQLRDVLTKFNQDPSYHTARGPAQLG